MECGLGGTTILNEMETGYCSSDQKNCPVSHVQFDSQ